MLPASNWKKVYPTFLHIKKKFLRKHPKSGGKKTFGKYKTKKEAEAVKKLLSKKSCRQDARGL